MVKNVYDSDSNSVTTSQGRVSWGKMGQNQQFKFPALTNFMLT